MSESIFSVEHTLTGFNVLKNGCRIATRKTFAGAAARALLAKYREQNKRKRGAK